MRVETKEYDIYRFEELDEDAKDKVRQWYLDGLAMDTNIFTGDVLNQLYKIFPESELKVQYDLGCGQGSGFNIYGKLTPNDIAKIAGLNEKETRRFKFYYNQAEEPITLPRNDWYSYCNIAMFGFSEDWFYDLRHIRDLDKDLIRKVELAIKCEISQLCQQFYEQGYSYFNEVTNEDLQEYCESNDYEFLKDGTYWS